MCPESRRTGDNNGLLTVIAVPFAAQCDMEGLNAGIAPSALQSVAAEFWPFLSGCL
jgi:hypothetical protein